MRKALGISLILVILFSLTPTTIANKQSRIPVIIGFKDRPDLGLVRAHQGKIKYIYDIIPAIAAELPEQAIERITQAKGVVYVEPDLKVEVISETLPFGVDRIDAEVVWGGSEDAKSVTGNAGSDMQVAVVDTGIDYTHPDLDANYLEGYDFANGDDDPKDDHGHGTHVSGIIAAEDNSEGVIGVAPEAGIYALKVLDNQGSGSVSDVIAGIQWAVEGPDGTEGNDDDAEVVSMSLGSTSSSTGLRDACDAALTSGTLPVAAAGNDGDGNCDTDEYSYPAKYDSVIAVGATDSDDSIASFSNSGPYLELVAPGVDIYSTMPTYDVTLTSGGPPWTRYSKNYDTMSGTSMSCPHVSGTAALVFAAGVTDSDSDGNLADDVRTTLDSTAEDIGYCSNCQGNGLVDAEKAVNSVSPGEPPTVSWVNPIDSEEVRGSVTIKIDASDTEDDAGTLTVEWNVDGGTWQTAAYNSDTGYYEDDWDSTSVSDGDHMLEAKATDSDGNTVTESIKVTTENTDNDPNVSWINPKDGDTVKDTVTIQIDAVDDRDSGSDLTVEWKVNDGTWQTATYDSEGGYYTDTWDTSGLDGDFILDARATDTSENSSPEQKITVTVDNQDAPTMYVESISLQVQKKGHQYESRATVKIVDENGNVVKEATVTGEFELNSEIISTVSGTTNGQGEARLDSGKFDASTGDTVKFTVTDVTHPDYSYDPDQNTETSETATI